MLMFFLTSLLLDKTKAENKVYGIQGNKDQEYQGSDGAVGGGDPEG